MQSLQQVSVCDKRGDFGNETPNALSTFQPTLFSEFADTFQSFLAITSKRMVRKPFNARKS
jgi:hypothetical protein